MGASSHMLLQGVWTDGKLAFTLGLDQMLHCWLLQSRRNSTGDADVAPPQQADHAVSLNANGGESIFPNAATGSLQKEEVEIDCLCSAVVQVLEPAALDVRATSVGMRHILVTGRGTQLLLHA